MNQQYSRFLRRIRRVAMPGMLSMGLPITDIPGYARVFPFTRSINRR